jgi:diadenosine tetraphosphate (Ap4A) HIT family hydrolase
MRTVKMELDNRHSPAGFTLSVNNGRLAGQTVEHAHTHVVPRYEGDLVKPNGLLREALPGPGGTWSLIAQHRSSQTIGAEQPRVGSELAQSCHS